MTKTALKSNPRMKDELAIRQLDAILRMLRSKIEGDPKRYGGLGTKLTRAERSVLDGRIIDAREQIIEIERTIEEKDEAAATQAQLAEQERLSEARGAPTSKAESGVATRDGWLWLIGKKRFSAARVESGRMFREKYERAHAAPVKSCLADGGGGGDANPVASNSHARFEVQGVRLHMESSVGHTTAGALFTLLEAVVGRGETVRQLAKGDDRAAEAKVVELGFALDLAGVYLGVVRT